MQRQENEPLKIIELKEGTLGECQQKRPVARPEMSDSRHHQHRTQKKLINIGSY